MVKERLWAAGELLKRYKYHMEVKIPDDVLVDALTIMMSVDAKWYQKKAARMLLDCQFGKEVVNDMIEGFAVVTDRNDPLVRRWRKSVLKRDGKCEVCGEEENLQAHHIAHWSEDPVNRINVDNGISLCVNCHSLEHPELSNLILSRKGVSL